jgi:hypothetical protein
VEIYISVVSACLVDWDVDDIHMALWAVGCAGERISSHVFGVAHMDTSPSYWK